SKAQGLSSAALLTVALLLTSALSFAFLSFTLLFFALLFFALLFFEIALLAALLLAALLSGSRRFDRFVRMGLCLHKFPFFILLNEFTNWCAHEAGLIDENTQSGRRLMV